VPRKILFVIRGKLGDSLIAHAAVRRYVKAFPWDEVTLLVRRDYARLVRAERGFRVVPFGSRLEMAARLLMLPAGRPFDVLAVLWGFGPPVRLVARLVRARRRIYLDGRFPDLYPEWPRLGPEATLVYSASEVIRCFEPTFVKPDALRIESLARARSAGTDIAVVPLANELRRNFDGAMLDALLAEVQRRHPGALIRVLVNPSDRGASELLQRALPAGVRFVRFTRLAAILEQYRDIAAWYGTDTGLYHLAAAMGIPATVFFGPTQPWKIVMPGQREVTWVRLKVLGEAHCDVTSCAQPLCLEQAVATYCRSSLGRTLEMTPGNCPLRAGTALEDITVKVA